MQRLFTLIVIFITLAGCSPVAPQAQYTVITHPDGPLYVGDRVSFEILAPVESSGEAVKISFNGQDLGSASFAPFGIGKRVQATFWWLWNTAGLKPGRHLLTFTLGDGTSWTENIRLRSASRVPPPEPEAAWASATTQCCTIYYITGTDAGRDLETLSNLADEQSAAVTSQMDTTLQERIPVIFMPRVVGHGGFAWDGVYLTYLDGSYVGNEMEMVLHHEFVHYYDDWIGGEYMPTLLQEGLAVYLSGGHFKPEPIASRAAALLDLGWFIPFETLADDFYNQQHEIGYLEAAALVQYLYETYGPGAFIEFYRTIPFPNGKTDSDVLDDALLDSFHLSLSDLETAFLSYLSSQVVPADLRLDLEQTVSDFDLIRRYQQLLDPSAYFLTAWLPDGKVMREQGIVADFTRRPSTWQNRLGEYLLIRVHHELFAQDYAASGRDLELTDWFLTVLEP